MLPFSAHPLLTLYVCIKFQENICKGFRVTDQTRFVYVNLQRGITGSGASRMVGWLVGCLGLTAL